jgi:hypothetical protein
MNLRHSALSLLVVLVMSLTLIGCSRLATSGAEPQPSGPRQGLANGTVVDDIRVGLELECATGPECDERVTLATAAATERHGLSPDAIGATQFYQPYITPGAALGSGGGIIVVFDLDDGSQAAVYTYCLDSCFVVQPQPEPSLTPETPGDHGPLVDPLVEAPLDCTSEDKPRCDEAVQVAISAVTADGFLTQDTMADAHYYVIHLPPDSPGSMGAKVDHVVDFYIAGAHDLVAETAVGVYCGSGRCQVVPQSTEPPADEVEPPGVPEP